MATNLDLWTEIAMLTLIILVLTKLLNNSVGYFIRRISPFNFNRRLNRIEERHEEEDNNKYSKEKEFEELKKDVKQLKSGKNGK